MGQRTVIPSGFAQVSVGILGPLATKPASFSFGVDSDVDATIQNAVYEWLQAGSTGSEFKSILYSQYTITDFTVRTDTTLDEHVVNEAGDGVAAGLMPPGIAALITEKSSLLGRRGRGRMYWPGVLAEADVGNDGVIVGATVTNLGQVADQLVAALAADSIEGVILHGYTWPEGDPDPGPPVGFPAPTPWTALVPSSIVGSQRRRQR